METPLSPLEFARRTRRLYPGREAVVDGELRLTYEEFFVRCDRWSAALQALGTAQGDRIVYIAPNTHAQLESFYAVPQIGAVLVPLNYRLIADDFAYLINHSGARIVCVHSDYLDVVESVRSHLPEVSAFVALEGSKDGWLNYETLLAQAPPHFRRPTIRETDLLTINYTSGTTSRPKGVMITHRNAYLNAIGTLLHHPMSVPTVISGRCRCFTPTAGLLSGSSPRPAERTSACPKSSRGRSSKRSRRSQARCFVRRRPS
jgi:fatty-acyl-CoA synthase